jgi:hypothetical protein
MHAEPTTMPGEAAENGGDSASLRARHPGNGPVGADGHGIPVLGAALDPTS